MQTVLMVLALLVLVLSFAIPIYSLVALLRALIRPSPYSAWPPALMLLVWLGQWPLLFVLSFTVPGGGGFGGDGHESVGFDLAMLAIFAAYNLGPFYWVYRHRARFLPAE
jgi:hypothetical protein